MRSSVRRLSECVLLAASVAGCRDGGDRPPAPGTDLYALDVRNIDDVLFRTRSARLWAYRWEPGGAFRLVIATGSAVNPVHCTAGDTFDHWLSLVARLPAGDSTLAAPDSSSAEWADLYLQDRTGLPPVQARLLVPRVGGQPVVAELDGRRFSTSLDPGSLRSVWSACAGSPSPAAARPTPN